MVLNMGAAASLNPRRAAHSAELDGENVVRAIPDMGYLHTGIEKSCERQNLFASDYADGPHRLPESLGNNLAYCWPSRNCSASKFRSARNTFDHDGGAAAISRTSFGWVRTQSI